MNSSWARSSGAFVEVKETQANAVSEAIKRTLLFFFFWFQLKKIFFARVHTVQDEQSGCIVVRRVLF